MDSCNLPIYYDLDQRSSLSSELDYTFNFIEVWKPNFVCEFSCSTGKLIISISQKVHKIHEINNQTGILEIASQKNQSSQYHSKAILIYAHTTNTVHLKNIGLVLLIHNFIHYFSRIEDWHKIIRNVFEILDLNGKLIIDLTESEQKVTIPFLKIQWSALFQSLIENHLTIERLQIGCCKGCPQDKIVVLLEKTLDNFVVTTSIDNLFSKIREFIDDSEFLPKLTWKLAPTDMIIKGIEKEIWNPLLLADKKNNKIISYLDYKILDEHNIEIGFCMTRKEYRGKSLMKDLFSALLIKFFDKNIIIGTHEDNSNMLNIIKKYNFILLEKSQDRINDKYSLYFKRISFTGFL